MLRHYSKTHALACGTGKGSGQYKTTAFLVEVCRPAPAHYGDVGREGRKCRASMDAAVGRKGRKYRASMDAAVDYAMMVSAIGVVWVVAGFEGVYWVSVGSAVVALVAMVVVMVREEKKRACALVALEEWWKRAKVWAMESTGVCMGDLSRRLESTAEALKRLSQKAAEAEKRLRKA